MSIADIAIRVNLLIITLLSFVPQYLRIITKRDTAGISLYYILLNLISATHQFSLNLHLISENAQIAETIVQTPPSLGDWLNLAQSTVLWISQLGLFLSLILTSPPRPTQKCSVVTIYITVLLLSLSPVITESTLHAPNQEPGEYSRWFSAIYSGIAFMFVNPVITLLALVASVPQVRELRSRAEIGALSIPGLAVQAVVFILVGLYWPFRMGIRPQYWRLEPGRVWVYWYQRVGWAAVDNLVFAIVQAVVLWTALRQRGTGFWRGQLDNERTPILLRK
ncbi:MAG: hypothetical protein M1814_003922 [Vezdaea aestivalis]|nr:MAG: hypothetical protein M1814_003922 [Vezdaea aestivalis]